MAKKELFKLYIPSLIGFTETAALLVIRSAQTTRHGSIAVHPKSDNSILVVSR